MSEHYRPPGYKPSEMVTLAVEEAPAPAFAYLSRVVALEERVAALEKLLAPPKPKKAKK